MKPSAIVLACARFRNDIKHVLHVIGNDGG
jgi:hypothetical protein